jgi:hypothetical protein
MLIPVQSVLKSYRSNSFKCWLIKLKFNTSKLLYKHLQLTPFYKLFTLSIQLQ